MSTETQPTEKTPEPNDALIGAMVADIPVPIRRLFRANASRSSFYKWRDGVTGPDGRTYKLRILDINGQGPSVVPSELRTFLLNIGKEQ